MSMQDNYVDMKHNYAYMEPIYVHMQINVCQHTT